MKLFVMGDKQVSQLCVIVIQPVFFGVCNHILKAPWRVKGAGGTGWREERHNGIRKKATPRFSRTIWTVDFREWVYKIWLGINW